MESAYQVRIRNLAVGGDGVGELVSGPPTKLGMATFVPFTIPGELVEVQVAEEKKQYLRGELREVIEPVAERCAVGCAVFGHCGGCELQHIEYEGQLKFKQQMVRGALNAARAPSSLIDALEPPHPSQPYGYRRRLTLHVDRSGMVGFYRPGTRSIVPIRECPVAEPALSEAVARAAELGPKIAGSCGTIILESDPSGIVAVLKAPYDLSQQEIERVLSAARAKFSNIVLIANHREVAALGHTVLELPLAGDGTAGRAVIRVPAGSFSQVNWEVNRALIARVCQWVNPGDIVLDLYAGAGNFALPLALRGARVTAVELEPRLVELGRQNIAQYRLDRQLEYVESSVERYLDQLERGKTQLRALPPLVIADPPRSGLGATLSRLQTAEEIVLISCHLPSFVRDAKGLLELGFECTTVQPFDMFAQTSYFEILSHFRKVK